MNVPDTLPSLAWALYPGAAVGRYSLAYWMASQGWQPGPFQPLNQDSSHFS